MIAREKITLFRFFHFSAGSSQRPRPQRLTFQNGDEIPRDPLLRNTNQRNFDLSIFFINQTTSYCHQSICRSSNDSYYCKMHSYAKLMYRPTNSKFKLELRIVPGNKYFSRNLVVV